MPVQSQPVPQGGQPAGPVSQSLGVGQHLLAAGIGQRDGHSLLECFYLRGHCQQGRQPVSIGTGLC
ncbi:MAG: hypothetical protein D6784_11510 [Chloroflexi bacterium]|nr:MAG: hypothetical protein D6784_11510 [Chloroflexota bacterium]